MTFFFRKRPSPVVVACALGMVAASTAAGQTTAPLGDRRLLASPGVSRWLGDVSACGGPLCPETASGEFSVPLRSGYEFVVGGAAGRVFGSRSSLLSERRADLRYSTPRLSAWTGAVRGDGQPPDTITPRLRFESGLRYATTNAEIAIALSAGRRVTHTTINSVEHLVSSDSGASRIDSVSGTRSELVSIAELRASWAFGRVLLSTIAGRGASLRSSPIVWGSLEAATPFRKGTLAFANAGVAASPGFAGFIGVPRRSVSVGLRFNSSTFASRSIDRGTSDASTAAFSVKRERSGQYRLRVKVPNARTVEIASDCTGWKPFELSHAGGSDWEIMLPVTAGAHLVNIRVDGGAWVVPPGLVAKADDFAGAVGVFVVD